MILNVLLFCLVTWSIPLANDRVVMLCETARVLGADSADHVFYPSTVSVLEARDRDHEVFTWRIKAGKREEAKMIATSQIRHNGLPELT